jgi:hypothetical protein
MRRFALLFLVCAGCPPASDDIPIFDERFEDETALRASWIIDGTVERVATIHPGEHGLRTPGPVTMTRPIEFVVWSTFWDGEWLEYSTNCPGAPEVWLEEIEPRIFLVIASLPEEEPPQQSYERIYASIPPLPVGDEWEGTPVTLRSVTLRFETDAADCVIDNLRFYQPSTESGY